MDEVTVPRHRLPAEELLRRWSRLPHVDPQALREDIDRVITPDIRPLPVHSGGGPMPGVDLTSNASLLDAMDEDRDRG